MKQLILGFLAFIVLFQVISLPVSAASQMEVSRENAYNFQSDPFLLQWTFAVKESSVEPTFSAEDKLMNHWKEKQASLWNTLPQGKFTINASAYTAAADECGKNDGITASGLKVKEGRTLACPASFPFGTKIAITGMGTLRCEDRGGAIKGNHFDIYMVTKKDAFAFGRQHLEAEIAN